MAKIEVSEEMALGIYAEIQSYEEVIDAASGSTDAGKRKIANELVEANESVWKKNVDNLVKGISGLDSPDLQVAFVTAVTTSLRKEFGETVDKYLDAQVEARKSEAPSVSAEELSAALEARKTKVEEYKAAVQLLEMFGEDVSELPTPKRYTGPRGPQGKRGPRVPKNAVWSIDGKDRSPSQNNLSNIFQTVVKDSEGCEAITTTPEFRAWLEAQGLSFENFPQTFSATLPNGKVLAVRLDDEIQDEEEEEEIEEVEE